MAKHQVQHKESRDKRNAKEMRELRSENNSLKRKIAKLQKYVQKMLEERSDAEVVVAAEAPPMGPKPTPKPGAICEACSNNDVTCLPIPGGKLVACKKCGWRKRYV